MDREVLRRELQEIFEDDTGKQFESLDDSVELQDGIELDSLDIVSLVMRIEGRYRIRLTHEELSKVATTGQLLDLILSKIGQRAQAA
jgi:acyl carrier protein